MEKFILSNLVKQYLKDATYDEIMTAIPSAVRKLDYIILHEGDDNGARREADYFAQLVAEQIKANRATNNCLFVENLIINIEKEKSRPQTSTLQSGKENYSNIIIKHFEVNVNV